VVKGMHSPLTYRERNSDRYLNNLSVSKEEILQKEIRILALRTKSERRLWYRYERSYTSPRRVLRIT